MLNQSSWFIRISSAHVDLIRNLMIHFTLRQIISDLVQSCHQIALSHFKTYRINCHFYESFHFMTIHSTCVVFLVVTAAHTLDLTVNSCTPIASCRLISGRVWHTIIMLANKLRSSWSSTIALFSFTLAFCPVDFHVSNLRFFIFAHRFVLPLQCVLL